MTDLEIETAMEMATPGPWSLQSSVGIVAPGDQWVLDIDYVPSRDDARLIAMARTIARAAIRERAGLGGE